MDISGCPARYDPEVRLIGPEKIKYIGPLLGRCKSGTRFTGTLMGRAGPSDIHRALLIHFELHCNAHKFKVHDQNIQNNKYVLQA